MADDIAFKVDIDGDGKGAKSLTELKKEFKEIQQELSGATKGTDAYAAALRKLAGTRDAIEDLNQEIQSFQGAGQFQAFTNVASSLAGGFQAATGAAALFGAESQEVEKMLLKVQAAAALTQGIKSLEGFTKGLGVLGNTLKANPIMLFATVIIGIGTALFALRDKIKIVGDFFEGLGNIISKIVQKFQGFTDAIGLTTNALDKQHEAEMAAINARNDAAQKSFDHQIKLLRALGQETAELEIEKTKALIAAEAEKLSAIKRRIDAGIKYDEEAAIKTTRRWHELRAQLEIQQAAFDTQQRLNAEKAAKDAIKAKQDELKAKEQEEKDYLARMDYIYKQREDALKAKELQEAADRVAARESETDSILFGLDTLDKANAERIKRNEEAAEKEKRLAEEVAAAKLQAEQNYINSAFLLSDAFFNHQLNRAQGNEKEQEKILKRQFQVEKAFATARAIIDGIRAVQATLAFPPLAISNGILATANVLAIQSTQFQTRGASNINLPSSSSGADTSQPITIPAPPTRQDETMLDEFGYTTRVVLVESDVTESQNNVRKIKNQASF
jgi:tRNA(Leu) C34 or U34 (ribose-2'-O)-methylase TrmL